MLTTTPRQPTPGLAGPGLATLDRLVDAFGQSFAVIETTPGVLVYADADTAPIDPFRWGDELETVGRSGLVEVIEQHGPLMLIAAPLPVDELDPPRVALALLVTQDLHDSQPLEAVAHKFGADPARLAAWAEGRRVWPEYAVKPLAEAIQEAEAGRERVATTETQLNEVSTQLLATFEELHLVHQMTECLSVGHSENELAEQAVAWLADVVPSESVVACLRIEGEQYFVESGKASLLDADKAPRFFESLGPQAERRAIVLNRDRTASPTWFDPAIREVVSAPVSANGRPIGWIAALNYREKRGRREGTFGTVEASLLSSVAVLLGVHAGNRRLFSEGDALFRGAVHALTSAVDAKDRYTSGHSDRVARIAVRLAEQLDCDDEELSTIYLGGLLHDIGKIGVDDSVLRKPGSLTEEEFAQVRKHPELGGQILRDVPNLAHVMPIVMHHHEQWDGGGYPAGLTREDCPRLARIAAVADAIDAMGSDRPYRDGMPIERVEEILREGAGVQWDPEVVDAYFAARDDIAQICDVEREPVDLGATSWSVGATIPTH